VTTSRDEILGAVRSALAGTAPAPRPPIPHGSAPDDVVGLFAERVADYRAVVERCTERQLAARLEAALPEGRVVVPAGLSVHVPDAVVDGQPEGLTAAELDACAAVVTDATVGIAETGTIVLDHGPGQGRRAITLVPDVHVCIVRADQVVADVPDAMPRLDPTKPLTWISGPSATSDIELDRVEGVHGPRTLHVLLVD
jgi:L-lactate dehydrogenase complex protein LldG